MSFELNMQIEDEEGSGGWGIFIAMQLRLMVRYHFLNICTYLSRFAKSNGRILQRIVIVMIKMWLCS